MCISPIVIRNPVWNTAKQDNNTRMYIAVPCNKCPECLNNRRNAWSYRINKESELYPDDMLSFVSIDYAPAFLHVNELQEPVLYKKDLQKFIKDIRNHTDLKFKYYAIGEYGETRGRPHYHILFFGLPLDFPFIDFWYRGRVDVGQVEPASIHYVAGYFMLQDNYSDTQPKPFSLMSKNIGIEHFIKRKESYLHYVKENQPVTIGNYSLPVPRYYKKLLQKEYNLPAFEPQFQVVETTSDYFYIKENYSKTHRKNPKLQPIKN